MKTIVLGLAAFAIACGGTTGGVGGGAGGAGGSGGSGGPCTKPFGSYTLKGAATDCASDTTAEPANIPVVFTALVDGGTSVRVGTDDVASQWNQCQVLLTASGFTNYTIDLTYDPSTNKLNGSGVSICNCSSPSSPYNWHSCKVAGTKN